MKLKFSLILLTASLLGVCGCKALSNTFGINPSAPSAVERKLFGVETNYVAQVVLTTNTVTMTNVVQMIATNVVGQLVVAYQTNQVNQYQVVTVTNQVPAYTQTTSAATVSTVQGTGAVINTFAPGIGSMVSSGLLAVLAIWGHLRSQKMSNTAGTIAQEVETLREFIATLPQGSKYDALITGWLQSHQLEAGVANQVLGLLDSHVDNPAAQAAVKEIQETFAAVNKPG